jgi:predicted RNA-binding Zn-ribbon protein involved in translation (DUF1610 family)
VAYLRTCPNCGERHSSELKSCFHCGYEYPEIVSCRVCGGKGEKGVFEEFGEDHRVHPECLARIEQEVTGTSYACPVCWTRRPPVWIRHPKVAYYSRTFGDVREKRLSVPDCTACGHSTDIELRMSVKACDHCGLPLLTRDASLIGQWPRRTRKAQFCHRVCRRYVHDGPFDVINRWHDTVENALEKVGCIFLVLLGASISIVAAAVVALVLH